jgi:enamine deaminase RidA (YjgF/YER057c/UK114 family)
MPETPHRIVVSPDLAPPVGYAQAIVAAPGRTVYLGGQTALNKENEIVGETIVEQFEVAANNVMTALRAAGGSAEHIVSMQIFCRDVVEYKDNLRELGKVWKDNFGTHYPASGLFGVTRLFDDPALVELMAIAVIPGEEGT